MKKIILSVLFLLTFSTFCFASPKSLTKEEERKVSLFFSNFAEVFLDDFAENELSESLMIDFAKDHIYMNRHNKLETQETEMEIFKLIPASMIDEICLKFFGKKPSKHEQKIYEYPERDYDAYIFAHIYGYEYNEKEDAYNVKGYILSAPIGENFKGDPYGDIKKWKKDGNEVSCFYCFEGKIKKSPLDKNRYILLSFKKHEITEEENAVFQKAYETGK